MNLHEVYRNSGLGKWFHGESATKEPGWDRYNSEGKRVGKCGDAKEGSSYSACLSKQKASKLGKEGRASFVKRKRAAQNKAGRGEKGTGGKGKKPINVDTGASKMEECYECEQDLILEGKNKPNDPEKWSACKSAAKSKFDVYPSAYANAWAAKCYKKKGGTWRSIKEETEMDEIKQTIKENIISSFMENAKPQFARRGAGKQRPKSWDKGTKSGSEKRKMREQGKREAREMNEGVRDFFDTDEQGNTRGLGRNYGVEHELDMTPGSEMTHIDHFEHVDPKDQTKGYQFRKDSRLAKHGIPVEMINTSTLLPKSGFEAEFAKHPNALAYLRDVKNYHWDAYDSNRAARQRGYSGAAANTRYHTQLGIATKALIEKIRGGQTAVSRPGDLTEGESWGPEFAGSAQDDATARAYEEQGREKDVRNTPTTHDEMVKNIREKHEAALAHAYTAATMGKIRLTPDQMKEKYHEHFRRLMGSD